MNNMKKYKLYLFDFDQTLFLTLPSIIECYKKTFEKFGVKVNEEDCEYMIKYSLPESMQYKNVDLKYKDEFIDTFHFYINQPNVVQKTLPFPETFEVLNYMQNNNILCGIVTSNSYRHIKDVFDFYKLDIGMFATFCGNELFKKPKPDPEPIQIALKKLSSIKLKDVLYVGDSPNDLLCAKNARIDCVLINRESNEENCIKSLMDIFR